MIRIQKGEGESRKELRVPTAAFNNFYKGAGWQRCDAAPETVSAPVESGEVEGTEEDEWDGYEDGDDGDEEVTKPLSEMTRSELEAYAAKLGVDLTGLNSNKQYREAIKAAM